MENPTPNQSTLIHENSFHNSSMSLTSICLMIVASSAASLATIGGNILVLLAFFVERTIRTASNYFIISLAVTDLLIGLISMNLFTIYLSIGTWPLSQLMCDLWLSLDYTACLTSQYTVLFITVDRFCSVKIPAAYRLWRTNRKVVVMVIITWLVPSTIFFTSILGWPLFNNGRQRKFDQCYAEFTMNAVFNTLLTIVYFWITLVVMCILYAGIYRVAKRLQASSEKRKGMSTLFAMAGQTMSRIGVGVSWTNVDEDENGPNLTTQFKINDCFDESKMTSQCDSFVPHSSPYKLNASPDLVKKIQYIDQSLINDEELSADNSICYQFYSTELEPGISEILPLKMSHIQNNNFSSDAKTISLVSKSRKFKKNQQKKANKPTGKIHGGINSLQKLQFTRFTFIHRKDPDVRSRNRARKALRTISLILGAFVTCWTPFHILVLIKGFCDYPLEERSCVNHHLYNLSYWLCYMNSPINPFCYALANAQIKATFMRLLRGDFRRNN